MAFQRAQVKPFWLRLALDGPAGSGKTFSALEVASYFAGQYGQVPAYIDTERGSASKYAARFAFDVVELKPPYHPDRFIKGVQLAVDEGYKLLVIDSLSHAWNGPGGLLELVDSFARKYGGNSYAAWKDATPIQTRLIDTLTGAECHIIACMRAKMDYTQDKDERGRTVIQKVGLAPVQREGAEYEFDVVGDIDVAHTLSVTKTRCEELTDQLFPKPGKKFADILWRWTQSGVSREQLAAQEATRRVETAKASPPPPPPLVAAVTPAAESVVYKHGDAPTDALLAEILGNDGAEPPTESDPPTPPQPPHTVQVAPPTPPPAQVVTGDGPTTVVIENRQQLDAHAGDILRAAEPPPPLPEQGSLPLGPGKGNGKNGNGNGNGAGGQASMAADVVSVFPGLCAQMVDQEPYYRVANGTAPDMFRILRAAKAEGYKVITRGNMAEVIEKLTARSRAHLAEAAAPSAGQ